jgi:hypothetical protein
MTGDGRVRILHLLVVALNALDGAEISDNVLGETM